MVCLSVCLSRAWALQKAERIDVLIRTETRGAKGTLYYVSVPIPVHREGGEWGNLYSVLI